MEPQKAKITPKDFFLWAGAMVTLYASVFSLIALLFSYIDYAYPNPLDTYRVDPYASGMPYQMASLIVLVPAFLLLMRIIRLTIQRDESRQEIWVRRWALFLTIFVAGATVIIDLIVLLQHFLSGQELTTGFVFKILVVFLIAGAGLLHFLADLRGYWRANPSKVQMVGWGVAATVAVAIIAGFVVVGTPQEARLMRFDSHRVNNLQTIQWQIVNYWQQKQKLPTVLTEIEDPISGFRVPSDPQTGASYEYGASAPLQFELCATFATTGVNNDIYARTATPVEPGMSIPVKGGSTFDSWAHDAGRVCFNRTIDPDRYPVFKN